MHAIARRAVGLCLLLSPALCVADDENELPAPGAWVEYFVIHTDTQGSERTGRLTMRFLEQVDDRDRPCRWIEFESEGLDGDNKGFRSVMKLLIPEESLENESNPCRFGIRGWLRDRDEQPRALESVFAGVSFDIFDVHFGPLLAFLPGVRESAEAVDDARIATYPHGNLECPTCFQGQHVAGYDSTISEFRYEYTIDYRVWLHDELPCGFAAGETKYTWRAINRDGTVEETQPRWSEEFVLQDFGDDAESALPDYE